MINLEQIRRLREETGCGVMEAKRALEDNPDFEAAREYLKRMGMEKAVRKEGRETSQGFVASYIHSNLKIGALVALGCETDFVARTEDFKRVAFEIAMQVAAMNPQSVDELLDQDYIRQGDQKVKDLIIDLTAKVGENIVIKDFKRLQI